MAWVPKKYMVLNNRSLHDKLLATTGQYVYECSGYDYGLARDDTYATGVHHISVTLKENGDYPSFTIPMQDLVEV